MHRTFPVRALAVVALTTIPACFGQTSEDAPACSGDTCPRSGSQGAEDQREAPPGTPSRVPPASTPASSAPCASNCTPSTLAIVPQATRVACSPGTIYAATSDGKIFAVPVAAPVPVEIAPAPSGVVGFMTWSNDHLFYTLPAAGAVHARKLADGTDVRLAASQPSPQGITTSGDEVIFGTEAGIVSVGRGQPDQTPASRVRFADAPAPVGPALGIAMTGQRFAVAHSPFGADTQSGGLGTWSAEVGKITHYLMMTRPTGVATSASRTYWSDLSGTNGSILFGPRPILANGLAPESVVRDQLLIGDICLEGDRIYFTALNDDDIRELRYVVVGTD